MQTGWACNSTWPQTCKEGSTRASFANQLGISRLPLPILQSHQTPTLSATLTCQPIILWQAESPDTVHPLLGQASDLSAQVPELCHARRVGRDRAVRQGLWHGHAVAVLPHAQGEAGPGTMGRVPGPCLIMPMLAMSCRASGALAFRRCGWRDRCVGPNFCTQVVPDRVRWCHSCTPAPRTSGS